MFPAIFLYSFSPVQTRHVLQYIQLSSPAILLVVFLVAFVTHGIITAPATDDDVEIHPKLGPGGRPLPRRRRSSQQVKAAAKTRDFPAKVKLFFNWLAAAVLFTLILDAIFIILQTIIYFRQRWWPGQAAVVSMNHPATSFAFQCPSVYPSVCPSA